MEDFSLYICRTADALRCISSSVSIFTCQKGSFYEDRPALGLWLKSYLFFTINLSARPLLCCFLPEELTSVYILCHAKSVSPRPSIAHVKMAACWILTCSRPLLGRLWSSASGINKHGVYLLLSTFFLVKYVPQLVVVVVVVALQRHILLVRGTVGILLVHTDRRLASTINHRSSPIFPGKFGRERGVTAAVPT